MFESGLLHFAGGPEEYRRLSDTPKEFLRKIPVAWDETRFLLGYPGKFVVIARSAGDHWYIGGINGEGSPREIDLKLSFLGPGPWKATIIEDGAEKKSLASRTAAVQSDGSWRIPLRPYGGFVALLAPGP